jgi:hypothetical protein
MSGTKKAKAQTTFPLRLFFPLKVVPLIEVLLYFLFPSLFPFSYSVIISISFSISPIRFFFCKVQKNQMESVACLKSRGLGHGLRTYPCI